MDKRSALGVRSGEIVNESLRAEYTLTCKGIHELRSRPVLISQWARGVSVTDMEVRIAMHFAASVGRMRGLRKVWETSQSLRREVGVSN